SIAAEAGAWPGPCAALRAGSWALVLRPWSLVLGPWSLVLPDAGVDGDVEPHRLAGDDLDRLRQVFARAEAGVGLEPDDVDAGRERNPVGAVGLEVEAGGERLSVGLVDLEPARGTLLGGGRRRRHPG